MAPVDLNIVCFRFNPGDRDEAALNALNQEILLRLHESGVAAPSYTTLRGRYALRAAITNHRSRREDFDILVGRCCASPWKLFSPVDSSGCQPAQGNCLRVLNSPGRDLIHLTRCTLVI